MGGRGYFVDDFLHRKDSMTKTVTLLQINSLENQLKHCTNKCITQSASIRYMLYII